MMLGSLNPKLSKLKLTLLVPNSPSNINEAGLEHFPGKEFDKIVLFVIRVKQY